LPELSEDQQNDVKHHSFLRRLQSGSGGPSPRNLAHVHLDERTALDEASRAPIVLSYAVRREILKQRDGTWLQPGTFQHPCNEELLLLDKVGDFLRAFSGLNKITTTPLPFPIVQMTKTILFVWIFALPFALSHYKYKEPYLLMVLVFLITFGFVGLEFVAMELSDPFGDDPSDFDDLGHAQLCFEDCYIATYKLDGEQWARSLRDKVMGRLVTGSTLRRFRETYQHDNWNEKDETEKTEDETTQNSVVSDSDALNSSHGLQQAAKGLFG
jgi:hypothetical protein